MTHEIEVSDGDGLVGRKDDELQCSIFLEPELAEVLPAMVEMEHGAKALQFQEHLTGAVQLDPEPEPSLSQTCQRLRAEGSMRSFGTCWFTPPCPGALLWSWQGGQASIRVRHGTCQICQHFANHLDTDSC